MSFDDPEYLHYRNRNDLTRRKEREKKLFISKVALGSVLGLLIIFILDIKMNLGLFSTVNYSITNAANNMLEKIFPKTRIIPAQREAPYQHHNSQWNTRPQRTQRQLKNNQIAPGWLKITIDGKECFRQIVNGTTNQICKKYQ